MKPLMIDLFAGLGGWAEGGLAEGYDVVGFDIEQHVYGEHRYPAQLVVQDVLTLHGSQFKSATLIVASPPCQAYSWRAMPWKAAKAAPPPDNTLFDACFRIQREACEAAGRHIPMVVENVRGAQKWVGRARWNFGSFYLWGDVPALMPSAVKAVKVGGLDWKHPSDPRYRKGQAFNPAAQGQTVRDGRELYRRDGKPHAHQLTDPGDGRKHEGSGAIWFDIGICGLPSKSKARKAASALIAKIPLPLSRHIAATYRQQGPALLEALRSSLNTTRQA